jgi:ribosomal protein S18 acetylase RimI-like enzyme
MEIIYTFTDTQIKELHALYQQEWWTKERTLANTRQCINGSQVCIGVIDTNGSLIGFIRVLTDYIYKALIFDLIVHKAHRNNGIGNLLLSSVKHHNTLQNIQHFELYCLPEMFGFYEKHGFSREVGNIKLMRYTNT